MKYILQFVLLLTTLFISFAQAQTDGPATLPTLMSTTFPSTAGYTTKTVCTSGCDYNDPATAYAAVGCKTVLLIRANQSFQDTLSAGKTCTAGNWLILMSDDCTAANVCTHLPAQGTRATSSVATYMPKITGANSTNAVTITITSAAAYNWFGPGLEITGPADGSTGTNDVTVDTGAADHIIWDRDYMHCAAAQDCQRMIGWEGSNEAVVDSSLIQAHNLVAQQSQAVSEFGGIGPFKIVNNLLGGAAEPILFGGSDCPSVSTNPHDIEVAGNDLYYDFGSRSASFLASPGNIRSVIEFKEGVRVLVQGNLLDASAVAGQSVAALNQAFLTWAVSQGPTCQVGNTDVVYRFNESLHSVAPVALAGGWTSDYMQPAVSYQNFSLHDNLFDDQNATNGTGKSEISIATESYSARITYNILFNHNTFISSDGGGNSAANFFCQTNGLLEGSEVYTNNIFFNGTYGVEGWLNGNGAFGLPGINQCIPAYTITANIIVGGTGNQWPSGNFVPATSTAVGFTTFNSGNGGNYQLTVGSTYHNAGTDGLDVGVSNFTCLNTVVGLASAGTYTESGGSCAGSGASPAGGNSQLSGVTFQGSTKR